MPDERDASIERIKRLQLLLEGIREQVDTGPFVEGLFEIAAYALQAEADGRIDFFEAANIGTRVLALVAKVRIPRRKG